MTTNANASLSSSPLRCQLYYIYKIASLLQRALETIPILNHSPYPYNPLTNPRLLYSPRRRTFLPLALTNIGNPPRIDSFLNLCCRNFNRHITKSNNRKIFTIELKDYYRRHLRNPLAGA